MKNHVKTASPSVGRGGAEAPKKRIAYSTTLGPGSKVIAYGLSTVSWIKIQGENNGKKRSLENSVLRNLEALRETGYLRNILRSSDLFHGKHSSETPGQFLIEPPEGWTVDRETITHGKLTKNLKTPIGVHVRNGLFLMYGAGPLLLKEKPTLLDVTPTVLQYLKLPIPDQIEGIGINPDHGTEFVAWRVSIPES
jgi:hypothetical protein